MGVTCRPHDWADPAPGDTALTCRACGRVLDRYRDITPNMAAAIVASIRQRRGDDTAALFLAFMADRPPPPPPPPPRLRLRDRPPLSQLMSTGDLTPDRTTVSSVPGMRYQFRISTKQVPDIKLGEVADIEFVSDTGTEDVFDLDADSPAAAKEMHDILRHMVQGFVEKLNKGLRPTYDD